MPDIEKVKSQFAAGGYVDLSQSKHPKSLLWQPDLILAKNKYIYLVLIKSNNSIPPTYLNRISNIPNGNYIPLIVFSQKLKESDKKSILSMGISLGYFTRGKLSNFIIKKKLSKIEVKKELKKLKTIDIFVSSKQDIPERELIGNRIEYLRKTNSYPFNPPHLIEHDKFRLKQLYKHINEVMCNCDWIVIILEDNDSNVVRYEIKLGKKIIKHENIFMFVKSTHACSTVWKKELDRIKKMEAQSIKYLPYSDLNDLEVWFSKAVIKRMEEIQKKKKVKIYV